MRTTIQYIEKNGEIEEVTFFHPLLWTLGILNAILSIPMFLIGDWLSSIAMAVGSWSLLQNAYGGLTISGPKLIHRIGPRFVPIQLSYELDKISDLTVQGTAPTKERAYLKTAILSFRHEKRIHRIVPGGTQTDGQNVAAWIEAAKKRASSEKAG